MVVPRSLLNYPNRRLRGGDVTDEAPSRCVAKGLRFYVGRIIRRQLATELALREYARVHLRATAWTMMMRVVPLD